MANTTPWDYKEDPIYHEQTGAIGAKTPQGDVVYGPLAENYLTPVDDVAKLSVPAESAADTTSTQKILDTVPEQWLAGEEAKRQEEIDTLKAERETALADYKKAKEDAKTQIENIPSLVDTVRAEQEAQGIPETLKAQQQTLSDIRRLRESAINLEQQRDNALAALGVQGIATPFISAQQNRISNIYNSRISAVAAQEGTQVALYNAQMGQVEQARGLVNDIVNATTFDTELELNKITTFLEFNSEELSMLDTEYQNALKESQTYWQNKLAQDKAEIEAKINFMITTEGKAGITQQDTLEEAIEKFGTYLGQQIPNDLKLLMAQFPTAGINKNDSYENAINKIAKMPMEATPENLKQDFLLALNEGIPYQTAISLYGADLSKSYIDDMFESMGRGGEVVGPEWDVSVKDGKVRVTPLPSPETVQELIVEEQKKEALSAELKSRNIIEKAGYWMGRGIQGIAGFLGGKQ